MLPLMSGQSKCDMHLQQVSAAAATIKVATCNLQVFVPVAVAVAVAVTVIAASRICTNCILIVDVLILFRRKIHTHISRHNFINILY